MGRAERFNFDRLVKSVCGLEMAPNLPALAVLRFDLWEVALRERATGSGLQIALEFSSGFRRAEFQRHEDVPRSIARRMLVPAGVVPFKPRSNVGRQSNVMPARVPIAPNDVHETLG